MPSFTDEELNFQDGIEELFSLYYLLLIRRGEPWFSEIVLKDIPPEIVNKMANLFYKTVPGFSRYQYYLPQPMFIFSRGGRITVFKRRHFENFLEVMDALRKDLWTGKIKGDLIKVERPHYIVPRTLEEYKDHRGETRKKKAAARFKWSKPEAEPRYRKADTPVGEVIASSQNLYRIDEESDERRVEPVGSPPKYDERFEVIYHPDSLFAEALYTAVLDDSPITNPQDSAETSFIKTVRYILVKFAFLNGSLNRIKVCLNCGTFLLQRKEGARRFCDDKCKNEYRKKCAEKDKPADFIDSCKRNQNDWLHRTLRTHETFGDHAWLDIDYKEIKVTRKDCLTVCKAGKKVPGGQCPVLRKNNALVFAKLEEYRKTEGRIRSRGSKH